MPKLRSAPSFASDLRPMRRGLAGMVACGILAASLTVFLAFHDIARHVQPQLGLVCLAAGVVCCFRRLWVVGGAWGVAGIFALYPVLPAYLPHFSTAGEGCHVTVVTFNHLEGHPDNSGAARLLATLRPDIVLAQKVYDTRAFRDALVAAGFDGFYSFLSPGQAEVILSRYKIEQTRDYRDGSSADVVIAGNTVRLRNLYAQRPVGENGKPGLYHENYAELEAELRAYHGPLILAGDGNASIFTPEIQDLRRMLRDSWDEAGFGLGATFPGPWRRMGVLGPWIRIDYIFHNDAFTATAAQRVGDAAGAGHYPVLAELSFLGHGEPGSRCE